MSTGIQRKALLLLFLPPAAAMVMGFVILKLALATDPGTQNVEAAPLSKTSWRLESARQLAAESP